jgi:hypothetical protein
MIVGLLTVIIIIIYMFFQMFVSLMSDSRYIVALCTDWVMTIFS